MQEIIRQLLAQHGRLHEPVENLSSTADLYDAGLTPFAAIRVMLALEEHFGVEFPVSLLKRQSFASIDAISACVEEIAPQPRKVDRNAA